MLVLKQGGSQKWLCNNGNQDASGKGSAVIGQQRNQSPRLVMQSFRIKVFSRLIHATQRLLQPRAFRGTDNMMRRASRPKAQDRQAIKENVQSLYGSSWDTVYERPPDNEMEPSKPNAISRAEYVSMEAIKAFMIDRCSTPPACLGDESDGLILLDNGSHRTRISLAEDLIRHFKHAFEKQEVKREGLTDDSDWIVLDFGNIFVHIMSPEARSLYDVEGAWNERRRSAEPTSEELALGSRDIYE